MDTTALLQVITFLKDVMMIFWSFAFDLMVPKLNAGGTGYDVTLLHVMLWVPIFFSLGSMGIGLVKRMIPKFGRK